jgi:hypothetical protein
MMLVVCGAFAAAVLFGFLPCAVVLWFRPVALNSVVVLWHWHAAIHCSAGFLVESCF